MNDELKHYGVLGMKWGHRKTSYTDVMDRKAAKRKAQNDSNPSWYRKDRADRAAAEAKRAHDISNKIKSASKPKRTMHEDAKTARDISKKKVSEMSNAELRKLNERQRLESEYKRNNKPAIAKGMSYVGVTAASMGTVIALYNNSNTLINIGKKAAAKMTSK